LLVCFLKLGKGFLQVLGVLGKLLDALHNAGTVIVIGDCRFRAA
jgi:formylmethanofuran dehydrogenase subunit C